MQQPESAQRQPAANVLQVPPDFSLVLGGPLYQLYLRTRLARPPLHLLWRRTAMLSLICWLPLFLLATVDGHLAGGVPVPFEHDPEVHIRFLVALPLLIVAEAFVHSRMRMIVPQFLQRGIIAPEDQPRFERIVTSAMRLRNSAAVEVIMLLLVLTLGHWIWRQKITLNVSSWYAVRDGGMHLTAAGTYYAFVSLSIFRFILLRWYFRLFLWYRFLWQVRALPLRLNLYHPDRAGGLGFLSLSLQAFAPVFVAQTALLAGFIYARILFAGQALPAFKADMMIALLFFLLLMLIPMSFFAVHLERAGRRAKLEFGVLASHYVDDFRQKWGQGHARAGENLLGTSDIQSLADLANSFGVVREIGVLPVTARNLAGLAAALVLPFLPLMLTMIPLDEVVKRLVKML